MNIKTSVMAIAMIFAFGATAMAQSEDSQDQQRLKKIDASEMAQERTDKMVKAYSLDNTQAEKLLALNNKYASKMGGPGMGSAHHGNKSDNGGNGKCGQCKEMCDTANRPQRPCKKKMKSRMKEMKANEEAYDNELKSILSDSQFKNYTEEKAKIRQHSGMQRGQKQSSDMNDNDK